MRLASPADLVQIWLQVVAQICPCAGPGSQSRIRALCILPWLQRGGPAALLASGAPVLYEAAGRFQPQQATRRFRRGRSGSPALRLEQSGALRMQSVAGLCPSRSFCMPCIRPCLVGRSHGKGIWVGSSFLSCQGRCDRGSN